MAASENRQRDPNATIRYLIHQQGGEFIIEIPARWRVTFAAVNPGANVGRGDLHCVRVWEGEKLRAVYADCKGFRDLSIPMARKVQSETREARWSMDSEGNFESSEKHERGDMAFLVESIDSPFASNGASGN